MRIKHLTQKFPGKSQALGRISSDYWGQTRPKPGYFTQKWA
ncbi:hypothetical protein PL9214490229 [Planktothrix tepida PCC 9214]|uniref:Uncharacterized protein n=1 Tax=Planktothrix tepida PCC 9214 TaxID=671072 RepID=A0A1J1LKY1_9CYAN|nr:hypothetical protein PL9214490229 [Planktothrix tepida PCC 9214]